MKTCPYCAEEIQDAAIKCRYCQSWLVDEIPAGAETPPAGVEVHEPKAAGVWATPEPSTPESSTAIVTAPAAALPAVEPAATPAAEPSPAAASTPEPAPAADQKVEFTHSGERYLLGYTEAFFGIWDRQSPAAPSERFPRTDDGWRDVWQRYVAIEANWMDLRTGQRSP